MASVKRKRATDVGEEDNEAESSRDRAPPPSSTGMDASTFTQGAASLAPVQTAVKVEQQAEMLAGASAPNRKVRPTIGGNQVVVELLDSDGDDGPSASAGVEGNRCSAQDAEPGPRHPSSSYLNPRPGGAAVIVIDDSDDDGEDKKEGSKAVALTNTAHPLGAAPFDTSGTAHQRGGPIECSQDSQLEIIVNPTAAAAALSPVSELKKLKAQLARRERKIGQLVRDKKEIEAEAVAAARAAEQAARIAEQVCAVHISRSAPHFKLAP